MKGFFLAMALFPDVQKKAQQEIDAVIGTSRMPDFSDRPSLPYVNALLKEMMRWHIVTPIALPHRVVADDEYNGYLIPGGAMIIANTWYVMSIGIASLCSARTYITSYLSSLSMRY